MILHDISDPADRIVRDRLPISFGRFRRVRYLELMKKKKKKIVIMIKGKESRNSRLDPSVVSCVDILTYLLILQNREEKHRWNEIHGTFNR